MVQQLDATVDRQRLGKKIQIMGWSGSGKTTLAQKLSDKLAIQHYELDAIAFLPGWKIKQKQEIIKEIQPIVSQDSWILCGDYVGRLDGYTIKHAETILLLNYPFWLSQWRVIKRSMRRSLSKQLIWGTNRESFFKFWFSPSKSLLWINLRTRHKNGKNLHTQKIQKYKQKHKIIECSSPKELEQWLTTLGS